MSTTEQAQQADEVLAPVVEFQEWFLGNQDKEPFLFMTENKRLRDGCVRLDLCFSDDSSASFSVICPDDYPDLPNPLFQIRTETTGLKEWAASVEEYAQEKRGEIKLSGLLSWALDHRKTKRSSLPSTSTARDTSSSPFIDSDFDEDGVDDEAEAEEDLGIGNDEDIYTTDMDIQMDLKKKEWLKKEKELRAKWEAERKEARRKRWAGNDAPDPQEMDWMETDDNSTANPKRAKSGDGEAVKEGQQIFTHESAAFQILSNELIAIFKTGANEGFWCEPIDCNVYSWLVRIHKFPVTSQLHQELQQLRQVWGYDFVELQLDFTPDYPCYPPLLRVVRPRFKGSMVQSLANIDLLKLTYWNPAKRVAEVLQLIKEILLEHAKLDIQSERNDRTLHVEGAYLPLEDHLIKLALATEVRPRANFDIINVDNLAKAPQLKRPDSNGDISNARGKAGGKGGWARGVGFGSGMLHGSAWDPADYIKAQEEKDRQILHILERLLEDCRWEANGSVDLTEIYDVMEGSSLVPYLETELDQPSFIEIARHVEKYRLMLELLGRIGDNPLLLPLLCNLPRQRKCLMAMLQSVSETASQYLSHLSGAHLGKETEQEVEESNVAACHSAADTNAQQIVELFNKLELALAEQKMSFATTSSELPSTSAAASGEEAALERKYKESLQPYLFGDSEFVVRNGEPWCHYHHKQVSSAFHESKAVFKEWTALRASLPLNLASSVFCRKYDRLVNLLQALIIGPEETPYANGCFLFDICFPSGYPSLPPMVNSRTNGGNKVRFNPNLYENGKVCLSLLGTWSGTKGENWNKDTSTLLQVLVSIQSLILVEDPYFNEPGYEAQMNTPDGKKQSEHYNKTVRQNCVKWAILEQLRSPPPGFQEVVRIHFKLKQDRVLKQLEAWLKLDAGNKSLKTDIKAVREELDRLH